MHGFLQKLSEYGAPVTEINRLINLMPTRLSWSTPPWCRPNAANNVLGGPCLASHCSSTSRLVFFSFLPLLFPNFISAHKKRGKKSKGGSVIAAGNGLPLAVLRALRIAFLQEHRHSVSARYIKHLDNSRRSYRCTQNELNTS